MWLAEPLTWRFSGRGAIADIRAISQKPDFERARSCTEMPLIFNLCNCNEDQSDMRDRPRIRHTGGV